MRKFRKRLVELDVHRFIFPVHCSGKELGKGEGYARQKVSLVAGT
jgi:hypothetical protein